MTTKLELLRKNPIVKSAIDAVFLRNKMGGEIGGDDIMREPYKKSDLVYICIGTTARAISQIPLLVGRPFGESVRPLPLNDPWNKLFTHPNYLTDRYSFIEANITHLLLDGDVFNIPFPPGLPPNVVPDSIWTVKKMYMKPDRDPRTGQLNGWWYNPKGIQQGGIEIPSGSIPLSVSEVSHIFLFNPYDPIMGLAPLEAGKINIIVDYKAAIYTSVFFDEGAVPGGVIATEQKLGDKQFNRTREQFEARHAGFKKGHRVTLLEQGLKYTQTGLSQKDMEFKSLRELTSERVYQIFGMKKAIISVMRDVNYACIPATERVYTVNKGGISIAEVESNDYVWSLGDKGLEKSKVIASWYQGKKKIYQLNTRNYKLRASYDHPILVLEKKVNGFFKISKHKYEGQLVWKPMMELRRGDFIIASKELPINKGKETDLEFCKFSGAFIGDGCVCRNIGKRSGYVNLAIPESKKELRNVYFDLMTNLSQYKISLKTRWGFDIHKGNSVVVSKCDTSLSCYGTLVDRLFDLDMVKDCYNKRVPSFIWDSGKKGALEFLKGYMDTDGSITKNGQCLIGSCNEELMKDTACILDYLGIIHGPVGRSEHESNFGHQVMYSISIGDPTGIGSDDPIDIERMSNIKNNKFRTKLEYTSDLGIAAKAIPPGFTASKVLSVEEYGEEDVYDLEVEGRHNFICNNIVVHNTAREERKEWWETTNIPLMNMMASALSFCFFPTGDLTIGFNLNKVAALREVLKDKVDTGYRLWQMGFTADEVNDRLDLGFGTKPWRTIWYQPINMTPIDNNPALNPKPVPVALPPAPAPALPPPKPPKPPKGLLEVGEEFEINIKDGEMVWEKFIARVTPLEELFAKKTSRVFFNMRKRTLELLYKEHKTPKDVDDELYSDETKEMSRLADPLYREALATGIASFIEETGIAISFNLADPEAVAFLANKNLKIKGVVQTIKDQIKLELVEAFEKGETVDEIADRIRGIFDIAKSRARTIARTEIIGAANESRAIALNRSGFKEKQWFTAMDEKVRPQHQMMHGKIVQVGQPWVFPDGASVRHPGDYDCNSPSQVINCRCIEIVVPGSHYLEN